jgi:signal transduction histidine kinase
MTGGKSGQDVLYFEASARLQRLFGRDLIPDDYSAVEELVKNAYDSNASEVTIRIVRPSGSYEGELEIRDNGTGLTFRDFKRVWMRAGYSEKTAQPLADTERIPVGEKGIGRFAADKLGKNLVVSTKTRGAREALQVTFDWERFSNKKRLLNSIGIPYLIEVDPFFPKDRSGTILRITRLRASWDDNEIQELRRRLSRLLNPYAKTEGFSIILEAPTRKLSGPIVPSEIKDADFEWTIIRDMDGVVTVKRRARVQRGAPEWKEWEVVRPAYEDTTPMAREFGPVNARIFFYADRPKKASIGDAVPGVAVYRDRMRVEPAGSERADWLGLLEKRAKRAGHMPLVPSRLFGFVEITREENPDLQDATNRRAIIHGPQLDGFRDFLKEQLADLEAQVEAEVAQPRWEKSKQLKSQKLLVARNRTLSIMSLSLAHELRQPLQSIQTASENIDQELQAAGVKLVPVEAATRVIARNVARIDKHIHFLKRLGSGREEAEVFDVGEASNEVIAGLKELAQARLITIERAGTQTASAYGNVATFLSTVTNLVLNSVQAIEEQADEQEHSVRIVIVAGEDNTIIRVEDDGPGIPEVNRKRLFQRQTTTKQGGMGVGLIVWREALQMFGGDLSCESFASPTIFSISLPTKAESGADSLS